MVPLRLPGTAVSSVVGFGLRDEKGRGSLRAPNTCLWTGKKPTVCGPARLSPGTCPQRAAVAATAWRAVHEKATPWCSASLFEALSAQRCVRRILALGSLHQLASACSARAVIFVHAARTADGVVLWALRRVRPWPSCCSNPPGARLVAVDLQALLDGFFLVVFALDQFFAGHVILPSTLGGLNLTWWCGRWP